MLKKDGVVALPDLGLLPTCSLEELSSTQCKWPFDNLMCCGRVRELGKPYCAAHQALIGRKGPIIGYTHHDGGRKPKPRPITTLLIEDIG